MKILISGSSGFLGAGLIPHLESAGHRIFRLVRRSDEKSDTEILWDPGRGIEDPERLEGLDALIHLSGENIAALRWTDEKKRKIRESRVKSTQVLAQTLLGLSRPPRLFLGASAIGFYGHRGEEILTEKSASGSGFLAEVCRDWEAASESLRTKGLRVVHLRFGMILGDGGPLAKMLPPFRLGLGGVLGDGRQYMSWITMEDLLGAVDHVIKNDSLDGPVNFVSPHPVTNAEFTKTLGRLLKRPTLFGMPAAVARLLFGEVADEMLLASVRAVPERLEKSGFVFRYPGLEGALKAILG